MHKFIIKFFSLINLFGFRLDLFTILVKLFRTVLTSLSFKGLTDAYLVKTFMKHKFLKSLFLEDSDHISAKSAAQILSLNLTKSLLLNFLTINLCNSSAICSFTYIPNPVFLSNL